MQPSNVRVFYYDNAIDTMQMRQDGTYECSHLDFYESGAMYASYKTAMGILNGECKIFNEDGSLKHHSIYKDDKEVFDCLAEIAILHH